jgi:hypothetical protein
MAAKNSEFAHGQKQKIFAVKAQLSNANSFTDHKLAPNE